MLFCQVHTGLFDQRANKNRIFIRVLTKSPALVGRPIASLNLKRSLCLILAASWPLSMLMHTSNRDFNQ